MQNYNQNYQLELELDWKSMSDKSGKKINNLKSMVFDWLKNQDMYRVNDNLFCASNHAPEETIFAAIMEIMKRSPWLKPFIKKCQYLINENGVIDKEDCLMFYKNYNGY